jgi:ABC-type branched-subunit amino acid transport system substrate-binding protein
MNGRHALPALLAFALAGDPAPVRIGLLLPADPALARETSRGAGMAVRALRAAGVDVTVVERRMQGPWGSEAGEFVRLVYEDGVSALVTGPDRASSHLAAQVAAKARVPVVVGSGASALTRIPLPWIVRVVHGERATLAALLEAVPSRPADGFLAAFVDPGSEGERLAGEIRGASRRAGWGDPRFGEPSGRCSVALVAASPARGGAAVRALRSAGFRGTLLLLPGPGEREALIGEAGGGAEGAILPRPGDPAAAAFDAILLLARAHLGADRTPEEVRAALLSAPPFPGLTGRIEFDETGDRRGRVPLETVRGAAEDHP